MRTEHIIVLPYDPRWKRDFEAIRQELAPVLGELALGIEHIGSTSVKGLSAKPIIDIDVVIRDESVLAQTIARLATVGYVHEGDLGIPGREAFAYTGKPHLQTHHLYVCPQSSRELHRHIAFRDFLRTHPDAVRQYGAVKEAAAGLFPDDIEQYMAYKSRCIEELYAQCGLLP